MGRRNKLPTAYDFFIVGEQLRCQMTSVGLIKDNRHHFRKYKQSFVAKDAIDWILTMHHVDTRPEAVEAMAILQKFNIIHHVTDEHDFKDKSLLFRFTKDDDTYKTDRELRIFYRALEIYNKIKQKGKDVMRNLYFKGILYSNVFYGEDLVDFLLEWEDPLEREDVVEELKDLLNRDVIKPLSEDCGFVDDKIVYKFNIDFYKSCLLHEVLDIMESYSHFPVDHSSDTDAVEDPEDGSDLEDSEGSQNSGLAKHHAPKYQPFSNQDKNTSIIQLHCDNVGFGMTLRGEAPCYVSRIEPLGPAAKARVKVGHSIISVNGQPVSHMDHRMVGLLIAQAERGRSPLHLGLSQTSRKHSCEKMQRE